MAAMFGSAINFSTARDLYPDASGASTAEIGSADTPYTTDASAAGATAAAAGDAAPTTGRGVLGQPLTWWAVLLALFFALGWAGNKLGGREGGVGVHNLKLSGYNILFVTLAAMIGVGAFKVLFTRFTVPGLSTYVQAL